MGEQMHHDGGGGDEQPREHPQDPSEGAREAESPAPREHAQDPAEGGDDDSATG